MNHHGGDNVSISRATSVSRTSRAGSTMSRNQSLIKKNIAPHDLRPSDILIERFVAWKMIVKQLIGYFEGLAEIHNQTAASLTKLSGHIQVPFRTGNQFLGEGGIQDIYYSIRDKTRAVADQEASFAKTIEGSIVGHLNVLRTEIKAHIKNIKNDTGKLATTVARERELSTKLVSELAKHIATFKNAPMGIGPKDDPYVANMQVHRQLLSQVHAENALQKSIIIIQSLSATFEASLIQSLQSAHGTFSDWNVRSTTQNAALWDSMAKDVSSLDGEREWLAFAGREDHLIDPETPLRNPETIEYPSKNDPSVIPVQSGWMERKARFTRTYKEKFFVLTPAGYLHEYDTSDPAARITPTFSLFLPACTLGPPSSPTSKSHKFHVETNPDKDSASTGSGKGHSIFSRGGGHSYTFRTRSHTNLLEWWNDLRMLCKRYLTATEAQDRTGPVQAAVRAAGYVSEEEEELDDDEVEGSSVEEEDDDAEGGYHSAAADHELPSYSNAAGSHAGAVGYPIDKKVKPEGDRAGNGNGNGAGGADLGRRPSKRQQEKAPEGKEPHVAPPDAIGKDGEDDGVAGPAPAEGGSKFTEALNEVGRKIGITS